MAQSSAPSKGWFTRRKGTHWSRAICSASWTSPGSRTSVSSRRFACATALHLGTLDPEVLLRSEDGPGCGPADGPDDAAARDLTNYILSGISLYLDMELLRVTEKGIEVERGPLLERMGQG